MPLNPELTASDPIERRVLFAVELIDPVTQLIVYHGVSVRAAGLIGVE